MTRTAPVFTDHADIDFCFVNFARERRTIRHYRSKMPPSEVIERMLLSAASAPSAHNRQPWRYVVIRDIDAKSALADAMGRRLAEDRRRDGDDEGIIRGDVRRSFERITNAPIIILVCVSMEDMDCYPDDRRKQAEFLMAVQSAAMATQNLLLAAHAEGLGSCWMCAPIFCAETVQTVLGLKPAWLPQGLISVGYPAGPGRQRSRKVLDQFVLFYERAKPPLRADQ